MDENMEKPSAYTLLYWLIQDGKIDPEDLFVLSGFYWPLDVQDKQFKEALFSNCAQDGPLILI